MQSRRGPADGEIEGERLDPIVPERTLFLGMRGLTLRFATLSFAGEEESGLTLR
jgi:hypothetical protein